MASTPSRHLWHSAGALLLGFLTVVVLSLATDQVLHMLHVYPPWGEPMRDPFQNLLALSYRIIYGIVGGYITGTVRPAPPDASRDDRGRHRVRPERGRRHRHDPDGPRARPGIQSRSGSRRYHVPGWGAALSPPQRLGLRHRNLAPWL